MNSMNQIHQHFTEVSSTFMQSEVMQQLVKGQFSEAQYASLFREIYHYTRENPQALGYASVFLRGDARTLVETFLKHGAAEAGHDQMALADMRSLGFATDHINREYPLPETMALISFIFYQLQCANVRVFLGYVYFLEFLATSYGHALVEGFIRAGIPAASMSFLTEHVKADVAHNRLMEKYVSTLVNTPEDIREVCYGIDVTANLYQKLIEASFRRVITKEHYGQDVIETQHYETEVTESSSAKIS